MNTVTLSEPVVLADLVNYQPGAVVSHTLVKTRAGTVTVFAFDAGEGLSEHTTPYDALLYVVDGRASVHIGAAEHLLGRGEIARLPAGIPHAVQAVEPFKMLLIMIRDSADSE